MIRQNRIRGFCLSEAAASVLMHRLPHSAKPHPRILPQRGICLKVLLMQDFQTAASVLMHRLPHSAKPHPRILPQRGISMKKFSDSSSILMMHHSSHLAGREPQNTCHCRRYFPAAGGYFPSRRQGNKGRSEPEPHRQHRSDYSRHPASDKTR